jgi:hypothetical protein
VTEPIKITIFRLYEAERLSDKLAVFRKEQLAKALDKVLKDFAHDAAGTSQPQGVGEGHGDGPAVDAGSAFSEATK